MKKHRKWSHKLTELSAGILVIVFTLIVLWCISYGVHYLTKTSSVSKVSTQTSMRPNNTTSTPRQASTTTDLSSSQSSNSNNKLSNTGPGDSELIVFAVASLSGSLIYYVRLFKKLASS